VGEVTAPPEEEHSHREGEYEDGKQGEWEGRMD